MVDLEQVITNLNTRLVCTHPHPLSAGGRGLNVQPNFQKGGRGGLTGPQLLEGVLWERGSDLFLGVAIFS